MPPRSPSGAAAASLRRWLWPPRLAFVGPAAWLESCAPPAGAALRQPICAVQDRHEIDSALAAVHGFAPHATVVLDPPALSAEAREALPGLRLGVLVGGTLPEESDSLTHLDRIVSFRPALTGEAVWRAIPPPVADELFAPVRGLHGPPRAITIGRSTAHREWMLTPAKHHHDLLQVIHGVMGDHLRELLAESDVGVYVPPQPGGGFGVQVGIHLAAGQLLVADELVPSHGLERNLDYLHIRAPDELVWLLDRLRRFPEMHQRIRVRGRMKAERYRASTLFARIVHDLFADVSAFGSGRR